MTFKRMDGDIYYKEFTDRLEMRKYLFENIKPNPELDYSFCIPGEDIRFNMPVYYTLVWWIRENV